VTITVQTEVDSLRRLRETRGASLAEIAALCLVDASDLSRFEAAALGVRPDRLARITAAYSEACAVESSEVQALLPARYGEKAGERTEGVAR
jgi:hypothetical protein